MSETPFRILNGLNGNIEFLKLRVPSILSWYACGPTVYDDAHIGHARTYISHDVIRRILTNFQGKNRFSVNFQMGITDIDDKIVRKSTSDGKSVQEISRKYEASFVDSLLKLNVSLPGRFCRVSDNIDNIIEFIEKLIQSEIAYQTQKGNIYFSIDRFKKKGFQYPKMCPFQANLSLAENFTDKESPQDFALWKVSKEENETGWEAFGTKGRPGWHIECSANIAFNFASSTLDLHSGGIDLKFPHHVNEIAQSEAYHNHSDWCTAFLHFGHIFAGTQKMSKSLGNFVSVNEFLSKANSNVLRMMCLKKKYGDNFEFTDFLIEDAKNSLSRLAAFKANIEYRMIALNENYGKKFNEHDLMLQEKLVSYQQGIENAARDNFDFPEILKIALDQVTLTESYYQQNQSHSHPLLLYSSLSAVKHMCQTILGLRLEEETFSKDHLAIQDKLLQFRFNVRSLALKDESFEEFLVLCDEIRDELKHAGLLLSDGKDQSIWKFRKG